jgi:hypothetical protein
MECPACSNMFRFICPSYYIPGKHDWGAFYFFKVTFTSIPVEPKSRCA